MRFMPKAAQVRAKMMSVGLHCRLIGAGADTRRLKRFNRAYIKGFEGVWPGRRAANPNRRRNWRATHSRRSAPCVPGSKWTALRLSHTSCVFEQFAVDRGNAPFELETRALRITLARRRGFTCTGADVPVGDAGGKRLGRADRATPIWRASLAAANG